jgi:hypothetical protein
MLNRAMRTQKRSVAGEIVFFNRKPCARRSTRLRTIKPNQQKSNFFKQHNQNKIRSTLQKCSTVRKNLCNQ